MESLPIVGSLRSRFTRHGSQLAYRREESRFYWCDVAATPLPVERGVYCLFSHDDDRIQKIGKADGHDGLRGRFRSYTGTKTATKLASDRTDQRWNRTMTDALNGERLSLYYFVTVPKLTEFRLDSSFELKKLECHWARSLERYLSKLVRDEYSKSGLLETCLLLSGLAD